MHQFIDCYYDEISGYRQTSNIVTHILSDRTINRHTNGKQRRCILIIDKEKT